MTGNTQASGTGQNYELLKFKPSGNNTTGTSFDGASAGGGFVDDQGPHQDVDVGDIWTVLNGGGIASTNNLIIGFDVNQSGSSAMDITALQICIASTCYDIDGNIIRVNEYNGNGSSIAELRITTPDLGYNFMTTYNGASTANFYIQATHANSSGGFDEYFVNPEFFGTPPPPPVIPEPTSLLLFGTGAIGAFLRRKKV